MPAYNAEVFIENSIKSVINQTYTNWELLVINDGSTDKTKDVAVNLSVQDNRVKVISQLNGHLGNARNTGISNAKGDWIAFLDSDDLWHPAKLEKQIAKSTLFPDVGLIYTDGWIFQNHDLNNLEPYITRLGHHSSKDMYKMLYKVNYIPVLSVLVKKDLILAIGPQEENINFRGCEDWDYWIRLAKLGVDFYGIPEKLFYYRKHDSNMSNNHVNMRVAQASVFFKNFDNQLFTRKEAKYIFKPLFCYLTVELLRLGRREDTVRLLKELQKILPLFSNKLITRLITLLGTGSLYPVKFVNKLSNFQ